MKHVWKETEKFFILNNNQNRVVHKVKTKKGYLFVFGKRASWLPTIQEAKDYVEACAELGRWPG
jgi:hypothetical protein